MSRVTPASSGTVSTFWVARRGNASRSSPGRPTLSRRHAATQRDQPRQRRADRQHARHHAERRVQRERQRPLRPHPVRLHPRLVPGGPQLVVQPRRRPPLGVGARAPGLEAGEALGDGGDVGHGQRAIIPRPVASAAVTVATDPAFAGLARQAELIAAGDLSSRELTETYLERIARLDPTLNAFRVVFAERALIEADQADGRRRGGDDAPAARRPDRDQGRHDVAGEVTARGTNAFGDPAREDAEVVRRLRSAGAVIIGKTNVPELEIIAVHRVADVRRDPQPVGPQPHPRRLERRLGRRGRRRPGRRRARLRRRRLDPHPRRLLRPLRAQAAARPRPDGAAEGAVARPLGLRHGHPPRRRHRAVPRRHRRRRAARARRRPRPPAGSGSVCPRPSRRRSSPRPTRSSRARSTPWRRAAARARPRRGRRRGPLRHDHASPSPPATCAGSPTRPRRCRTRSASRAAPRASAAWARRSVSRRARARPRRGGRQRGRAIATVFERADVLMTPMFTKRPIPIGTYEGRGALWTFNGFSRWVPYNAAFNHTGQPAASVPAGFTDDGFPLAVQLVGRPGDEATLRLARRPDRGRTAVGGPRARRFDRARRGDRPRGRARSCATRSRPSCGSRRRAARPTSSPRPTSPPRR